MMQVQVNHCYIKCFKEASETWGTKEIEVSGVEFSTQRAFKQVRAISRQPHYVGSKNHEEVAQYLLKELEKLGLETSIQEGYTLSDWGNLVKSKNLLARIKGTDSSKALLLLSHYDSAPHSYSLGASDAGSGVATIICVSLNSCLVKPISPVNSRTRTPK